jgi:hypothetical protein
VVKAGDEAWKSGRERERENNSDGRQLGLFKTLEEREEILKHVINIRPIIKSKGLRPTDDM